MWPVYLFLRSYLSFIAIPVGIVFGAIGYNLENLISDKYTPGADSIKERRAERLLDESGTVSTLKEHAFVPKTIFEKNLSPSLQKQK